MNENKDENDEQEVEVKTVHVFKKDMNITRFALEAGKETVMILEEDRYDLSN
jgi:hypothetical protein